MSVTPKGLHHVGVVVRDLYASIDWYNRHLGFQRGQAFAFPGVKAAFIAHGDLRLELFQVEGAAAMAPERQTAATNLKIGGINHFAITVSDLDQAIADLTSQGVEVASQPASAGGGAGDRFAFIRDNEGMLVELYQPA